MFYASQVIFQCFLTGKFCGSKTIFPIDIATDFSRFFHCKILLKLFTIFYNKIHCFFFCIECFYFIFPIFTDIRIPSPCHKIRFFYTSAMILQDSNIAVFCMNIICIKISVSLSVNLFHGKILLNNF